jgi:hypothetical protein
MDLLNPLICLRWFDFPLTNMIASDLCRDKNILVGVAPIWAYLSFFGLAAHGRRAAHPHHPVGRVGSNPIPLALYVE